MLKYVLPLIPFATTARKAAIIESDCAERSPRIRGGMCFDGQIITQASVDACNPMKAASSWRVLLPLIGEPIKIVWA